VGERPVEKLAAVRLERDAASQVRNRAGGIVQRFGEQGRQLELKLDLAVFTRIRKLVAQQRDERLDVATAAIEIDQRAARTAIVRPVDEQGAQESDRAPRVAHRARRVGRASPPEDARARVVTGLGRPLGELDQRLHPSELLVETREHRRHFEQRIDFFERRLERRNGLAGVAERPPVQFGDADPQGDGRRLEPLPLGLVRREPPLEHTYDARRALLAHFRPVVPLGHGECHLLGVELAVRRLEARVVGREFQGLLDEVVRCVGIAELFGGDTGQLVEDLHASRTVAGFGGGLEDGTERTPGLARAVDAQQRRARIGVLRVRRERTLVCIACAVAVAQLVEDLAEAHQHSASCLRIDRQGGASLEQR
jgi:hypothetical protein